MKKYKINHLKFLFLFLGLVVFMSSCKVDDVDKSLYIGEYTVVQKCGSDTETNIVMIEDASFAERTVTVINFPYNSQNYSLANIEGNKIVFPKQSGHYLFSGEGNLSGNTIEVNFTVFDDVANSTTDCTATFTRN